MAKMALVDTDKLDADLLSLADKIRAKGNATDKLEWPAGFEAAVESIPTGVTVQKKSGYFTTKNGSANITCGFQPDIFFFTKNELHDNYTMTGCLAFAECSNSRVNTTTWDEDDDIIDVIATRNATGVSLTMYTFEDYVNWEETYYNGTFDYVAVKYT